MGKNTENQISDSQLQTEKAILMASERDLARNVEVVQEEI